MRRAPVIELSTVFLEAMLAERMVEKQKFFSANWKFISGIKIYTRVLKIEGKKYNNFSRKIDAAIEDARSRIIISWIRNAEACCDAGLCKNKNHRSARRSNVSKMQNSKLAPVQLLFQRRIDPCLEEEEGGRFTARYTPPFEAESRLVGCQL